ncbi:MAG: anthranilate phosphoribosyltransferase [Dehalococcoidia bacterium]|nr:anthranilate phosphoribosyltransferase [Dehalococcoidia bacterium]
MIKEALSRIVSRNDLTRQEAREVMGEIMRGEATAAQIGAFLTGLRMKGETVEEIAGCVEAMRNSAVKVRTKNDAIVDTCGTGGDGAGTFNISTTAAFVAAGAGVPIAKHGNRSVSSRCGSADLLQALGVNLEIGPEKAALCIDEVGIGFLFAPLLHPAMKHALGPRRDIGLRTIFNLLGPLANPAGARRQLLGVYDGELTELIGSVLLALGAEHAMVVHGAGGLDELSTAGVSKVSLVREGSIETTFLDPADFGLPLASVEELKGGEAGENAAITRAILQGQSGPKRDIVLLNAAAVLIAGGKAVSFEEGLIAAAESIDSGKAFRKLEQLVEFTQSEDRG